MQNNEDIAAQIAADLTIELKNEVDFDVDILNVKISNAIREVIAARNYPAYYGEERIKADLMNYYSNIRSIALYDYTKIGAEGQTQYSADGESIHYLDRSKLFSGILPIARA